MNALTDREIIEGLRTNNEAVITYMYQAFAPKVLGIVIKNSGNEEDGQDLFQTVLLKVWKNIRDGSYQEQGKFQPYFFSVAYKDWLYELRKRKGTRTQPIDGGDSPIQIADDSDTSLFQAIVKEHSLTALQEALVQVGEGCGSILKRFHLDKIPTKEIAEEQNTSDGYIRKRLFECRQRLKNIFSTLVSTEL
jgi:RNA polymerase sigma factor (sigma-70 family)